MSFDSSSEDDSRSVSLGIYGKKQVSVDLVQKIKEGMESMLVELKAKQISQKLLMSSSNLQSSEVKFLKKRARRQVDLGLSLPPFIQDPMHFCVIARQLFICSQIFVAPLSFYNTEKREKNKNDDDRDKRNTEEREREYNRVNLSSISHPSAIGYNLYDKDNVKVSTNQTPTKLNPDFRPKLTRNKHVESVWGNPKKHHPVFFENMSNTQKSCVEGKLVIWNQNDFTFLYNEIQGQAKGADSKTVVDKTIKGTNIEKQRLVGEIGQGLVLVEFSIGATKKKTAIPSGAFFIGSKESIETDIEIFDSYSSETTEEAFTIHVTSNDDSVTFRHWTDNGRGLNQEDENDLPAERLAMKVSIYHTMKMNMKGISEFCVSLMDDACKIYCIERSCLAHVIKSPSSLSFSSEWSRNSSCLNKITATDSFELVNILSRILCIRRENLMDSINTLGHYFYDIKLPKAKALTLHGRIVSTFLQQYPFFRSMMTSLYIEPTKFGFHPSSQTWCEFLQTNGPKVNVTIFSDIFKKDDDDMGTEEEHQDIQDVRILADESGNVASHLIPPHFRRKHILLKIVTTSLGIHVFHYNVLPLYANSLKKAIKKCTDSFCQERISSLQNVYPGLDIQISQDQRQFISNLGGGINEEKIDINPLSWASSRLYRLLPREVIQSKISFSTNFSEVPPISWRRGILISNTIVLIPKIFDTKRVFKDKIMAICTNLDDVDVMFSGDTIMIIHTIPFSSSIHSFELRVSTSNDFAEVTHRISDSADIFRGPTNASISTQSEHYYDNSFQRYRDNRGFDFDLSTHRHICKESIGETSYFSSVFEDPVTTNIQQCLASMPLSIFYDDMLTRRRHCGDDLSNKVTHFQNMIRSLNASSSNSMYRKWAIISLENEKDLMDKKFNIATPSEISNLFKQNDLQNELFMLEDVDSVNGGQSVIMMGCLFHSATSKYHHLAESRHQFCARGFALFRSDFKQLHVLSVLFLDSHNSSVFNIRGKTDETALSRGALPIELDMLSVTDPLTQMSKELKRVLVEGLNNISIHKNWEYLRKDIAGVNDDEIFVTIRSSKRVPLEFLKFVEPIINSIAPTIKAFLDLLSYLEDVNIWSSTTDGEKNEFIENPEQTDILLVDTRGQHFLGLHIILHLNSARNILLHAELVYYDDAGFNNYDTTLAQKSLLEKFVNLILHFSFLDEDGSYSISSSSN